MALLCPFGQLVSPDPYAVSSRTKQQVGSVWTSWQAINSAQPVNDANLFACS